MGMRQITPEQLLKFGAHHGLDVDAIFQENSWLDVDEVVGSTRMDDGEKLYILVHMLVGEGPALVRKEMWRREWCARMDAAYAEAKVRYGAVGWGPACAEAIAVQIAIVRAELKLRD